MEGSRGAIAFVLLVVFGMLTSGMPAESGSPGHVARRRRCAFGGCSITIGGNNGGDIKMLMGGQNGGLQMKVTSQASLTGDNSENQKRTKRCSNGDCDVHIGGQNTGRITGARRVVVGGSDLSGGPYGQPSGGQYGGSYGQPSGGQYGGSYGQPSGSQYGGSYGQPSGSQYGGSYGQPSGSQYGGSYNQDQGTYGTQPGHQNYPHNPRPQCTFGRCSVDIPGNNNQDINL